MDADGLEAYTALHQPSADVSACIIVRDQKTELLDWIAHHQRLGEQPQGNEGTPLEGAPTVWCLGDE